MLIKGLVDEDFTNYKKPSMFIIFPSCTLKCDKEAGCSICQNSSLANEPDIRIINQKICLRYLSNPITQAIVCGGLEPMDSFEELKSFIFLLRFQYQCNDDIVIYTGYKEEEIQSYIETLSHYENIIIKCGRYIPNQEPHYDVVLGVKLASDNQYARRIS